MFRRFVAVDWSGAQGNCLPGIAVAVADAGDGPPRLIDPPAGSRWSRDAVAGLIAAMAAEGDILMGADFSFSLPYADAGGYFPDLPQPETAPDRAQDLWQLIDDVCAGDGHLYAGSFATHADFAPLFRRPGIVGSAYAPRLRVTEDLCRASGLGPAQSAYNLIGAAQVGLASLAGMRILARLDRDASGLAIWPFDQPAPGQTCFVEIYTRLFLRRAGVVSVKLRDRDGLKVALQRLGCRGEVRYDARLDDHRTDALVSAAGLRHMVRCGDHGLWNPPALSDKVRATEGWTFGVV